MLGTKYSRSMTFVFPYVMSISRTTGVATQAVSVRQPLAPCRSTSAASLETVQGDIRADANFRETRIGTGFRDGTSVEFWRSLDSESPGALRSLLADIQNDIRQDPSSLPYFIYCLGRSFFFAGQGMLPMQMVSMFSSNLKCSTNWIFDAITTSPTLHFVEAGYAFRQDYANIRQSIYRWPWDMSPLHRQFNPAYVSHNMVRYIRETQGMLSKMLSKNPSTDVWMNSVSFPDYYKQTYHFQNDGWMSSTSANVYEVTTEALFSGRQDAMQRLSLVALSDYIRKIRGERAPKVLEIAGGTGRLATFVLDNFPNTDYILNDLSPFYLEKARENIQYWKKFRGPGFKTGSISYLQGPAENLTLPSESLDVVLSVYLFHELPPSARRNVAKEAARLLKPGGMFVFVDSVQNGDRPFQSLLLENFEKVNEPWYPSFLSEDFGKLFEEFGLVPDRKELSSVTKLLTFIKHV